MEPKKNECADLSRRSPLFFHIGLAMSLLLVIMAFEYKAPDQENPFVDPRITDDFESLRDVPITEIPPPPAPLVQPQIKAIEDDAVEDSSPVNHDAEIQKASILQAFTPVHFEVPDEPTNDVFIFVEESASPEGGLEAFYRFIASHVRYPVLARRMGVEGRVFVEFIVNRDGTLVEVKAIKGIGAGCDEEAVRVIASAPHWNPGKQRGRPVRQKIVIPVLFKLG